MIIHLLKGEWTMDKAKTIDFMKHENIRNFVLTAMFSALIIVMTIVPYTGYIKVGLLIDITTLHIVVAIGAILLGWKYGAFLGLVWGVTCFIRAFTDPASIMFTNPLISVLPRIIVGLVAGLVFEKLSKTTLDKTVCALIAAIVGTLTNTVLVLSAIYIFGGMFESYKAFFELFKTIFATIISLNGGIEIVAAVIIVPLVYKAAASVWLKHQNTNGR